MKSHYEALGIPESAAAAWIEREYQRQVELVTGDVSLKDKQRQSTLAALAAAKDVLLDPVQRAAHDAALACAAEKSQAGSPLKRLIIPVVLVAVVAVAAGLSWQHQENKRLWQEQQERERVAEEARARERAAAAERRKELLVAEAGTRQQEEDERLRVAREQREEQMKGEQYVAGRAYVPQVKSQAELRDERQKQMQDYRDNLARADDERRKSLESARELSNARAAVDRQKKFLEQQKYEEEIAARQRELGAKRAEKAGR